MNSLRRVPDMNPLSRALKQFTCQQTIPQHKAKKMVQGMNLLVDDLIKVKERMTYLPEQEQAVNKNLDEIKKKLKELENEIPSNPKNDFLPKIKEINTKCTENTNEFKRLIEAEDLTFEELEDWTKKHNFFDDWEKNLDQAFDKCEKLKKKITFHDDTTDIDSTITKTLICRLKNLFSTHEIYRDVDKFSDKKYDGYVKKYKELKLNWGISYIKYQYLKTSVNQKLIRLKTNALISEFNGKIEKQDNLYIELNRYLDSMRVSCLNANFDPYSNENNYKRSFEPFFDIVKKYAELKKEADSTVLNQLEKDIESKRESEYRMKVYKASVRNIKYFSSLSYSENENSSFEELLKNLEENLKIKSFENKSIENLDDEINHLLKSFCKFDGENLACLRNELTKSWDDTILRLVKTSFEQLFFNKVKDASENLLKCYFFAEDLHGNLRQLRYSENSGQRHILEYSKNKKDYNVLFDLLSKKQWTYLKPVTDLIFFSKNINNLLDCFPNKSSFNLIENIRDILGLYGSYMSCCDSFKHSTGFNDQEKIYEDRIKKQKNEIKSEFEMLKKMIDHVVKGMNDATNAVKNYGNNDGYGECFTKAYNYEDPRIDFLQTSTGYLTGALIAPINYAASGLGYSQTQIIPSQENLDLTEVFSPIKDQSF